MNCLTCGSPLNQIPAGFSKKTGKPYNAFMACPNKCFQKPQNAPQQNNYQRPVNTPIQPKTAPQVNLGANTPIANKNSDIRENVVLKMISEIISAGKIDLKDWKYYANEFYFYTPEKNSTKEQPISQEYTHPANQIADYEDAQAITDEDIQSIPF